MKFYWISTEKGLVNLKPLMCEFFKHFPRFDNADPQDAQEAILCIIDILERSCPDIKPWFYGKKIQETIWPKGKTMKEEVVREFYRPLVKEGKHKKDSDERYPDTVKFKIRTLNGDVNLEVYDKDRNKTTIDELVPGSKVRCIFELSPVWFVNKNFGITLNLIQLEVSKPEKISGFSFDDDEEFEEYEDIED